MSERLRAAFPGLRATPYRVTSQADPVYNCIAWAGGSDSDWWWPLEDGRKTYWPLDARRELTLDAFRTAFMSLGYSVCDDDEFEPVHEKVAIFTDSAGRPTHAARQLPTGRWSSKLGQSEDIEHELHALEGAIYGAIALILKRRVG